MVLSAMPLEVISKYFITKRLASWANKTARATGLDLDYRRAARRAGLALAVGDQEKALVPAALFAVQIALPRTTALVNALLQRLLDCLPQGSYLVVIQRIDFPQRVDPWLEQRVLDVDVADASDPALVEEEGFSVINPEQPPEAEDESGE